MKQNKHLVILKGLNKVEKEGWKGMKLNISYIGNFNEKMFGIANKKITPQDIIQYSQTPFSNEILNSMNQLKFSKNNFKELHLDDNAHSRNRMKLCNDLIKNKIMPEFFYNRIYPKRLPFLSICNSSINSDYNKNKFYSLSCDMNLVNTKIPLTERTIKPKRRIYLESNTNKRDSNNENKAQCIDRASSPLVPLNKLINGNLPYSKKKKKLHFPCFNLRQYNIEDYNSNDKKTI